jgi:ABC-2 type transport system ATP-binding protein
VESVTIAHILTLTDVRKSFGATRAVDGLSLEIRRGEVFGFLGPNGAGKTTTIGMMIGLLRPDSGTVTIDGGPDGAGSPEDPRARAMIGVAPQAIALYDEMSADENLSFFASLYGLSGRARAARVTELLEMVGLADRRRERIVGFSGGMKRRLNLAAALLHDPRLVLLDEPTAGVDPQSRNAILDLVRAIRAQDRTVVYTTHYMEEAQRLCDRVAIIDHGRLLDLDTVDGLIAKHTSASVVTIQRDGGDVRIETADPVGALASHVGQPGVRGVRVERPNLESVFLHLTGRSLRD